jgi:DUF4097 and DUF4098 domain-containing protein YvlB
MSLLEAEAQTASAFKSSVEDLALEELSRLDLRQLDLQGRLAVVQDEIKAVKAILKATSSSRARPKPKQKKKEASKAGNPFKMSEEREVEWVRWLTGNRAEITSKTAAAQFPEWSESYVNMALKDSREQGVLRLAATSGSMNIYRSML